jgi:hypothetical protein
VHFNHQRVCAGGDSGQAHLRNKFAQTKGVCRIDDDRQMRLWTSKLEQRLDRACKRAAISTFECRARRGLRLDCPHSGCIPRSSSNRKSWR